MSQFQHIVFESQQADDWISFFKTYKGVLFLKPDDWILLKIYLRVGTRVGTRACKKTQIFETRPDPNFQLFSGFLTRKNPNS